MDLPLAGVGLSLAQVGPPLAGLGLPLIQLRLLLQWVSATAGYAGK